MENETKGKTEVNDVKEIKDVKDYKDAKIKIDIDRYRVKEGDTINLKKFATYCDQDVDKSAVKNYAFPQALDEISLLQAKLFAQSTYGVQQRFEKITSMHIEKVMDGIRENTTRVWNTKAYLMAALFNSVSTIDNHYAMLVNHDFHGGP